MNITLIGMPGAGKSTVGVVLSKLLNLDFTDTDLIIQRKHQKRLHQLIEENGAEGFIKLESEAIKNTVFDNTVIATGGSAVYSEESMEYLKSISKIVYINVPLKSLKKRVSNLEKRGVVSINAKTLDEIFRERSELYEKYSDFTVCTEKLTIEQSALKIASLFE